MKNSFILVKIEEKLYTDAFEFTLQTPDSERYAIQLAIIYLQEIAKFFLHTFQNFENSKREGIWFKKNGNRLEENFRMAFSCPWSGKEPKSATRFGY